MQRQATPAEIRIAITKAITEDYKTRPYGGTDLPIPVRVHRLIDDAITSACNSAQGTEHGNA